MTAAICSGHFIIYHIYFFLYDTLFYHMFGKGYYIFSNYVIF